MSVEARITMMKIDSKQSRSLRNVGVLGVFAVALSSTMLFAACSDSKDTSSDGSVDDNGDAGAADEVGPPIKLGEAITAPESKWTWIDFPETRCMDDSATGLGIKLVKGSDKAIVVIQGGGACFNDTTCATVINANGFGAAALTSSVDDIGLLKAEDADNPFKDWNMVFIPYCSGDIFSGNAANKTGYKGRTQVGYQNFREYLARLVPTFKDMKQVVLSGYSAGGFAAAVNWVQARQAFGQDKRVDVLDDSGPTLGPKYLTPCLQMRMAQTWNWKDTIPKGCTKCDLATGNVSEPAVEWSLAYTKKGRIGVISSNEDFVIKSFFGFGQDDCKNIDGFLGNFPSGLYPEGLAALRETYKDHPGAAMYVVNSTQHVWTTQSPGSVTSAGVVLRDWINDFLDPTAKFENVVPQ